MSDLFTKYWPDPVGVMLGTGVNRFESQFGIDGLAKWNTNRLDVLAVAANKPGVGHFRLFIDQAKKHFREIYVWEDWNPLVGEALARYGFERTIEKDEHGETLTGWKWKE